QKRGEGTAAWTEALFGGMAGMNPDHPRLNLEYAMMLYNSGRRGEALEHLLGMYRRGNREAMLMNNIGVFLCQLGRCEEAIPVFTRAVQQYPDNPGIRINFARTYYTLGDLAGAKEQLLAARRLNADIPKDLIEIINR
ncbi:MAG: tetratricopeptide repeat protein, partial [Candidatus Krumholzibacteria bacterium]|nr:tetratricopeptide repeat protein [Candidatus Krumholzibacteria bacterium]